MCLAWPIAVNKLSSPLKDLNKSLKAMALHVPMDFTVNLNRTQFETGNEDDLNWTVSSVKDPSLISPQTKKK